jgi:hypothetical protein
VWRFDGIIVWRQNLLCVEMNFLGLKQFEGGALWEVWSVNVC